MDLYILVADPDGDRRNQIEKQIEQLSLKEDIHRLNFFECSKEDAITKLGTEQCLQIHLAFLSLEFESAEKAGA